MRSMLSINDVSKRTDAQLKAIGIDDAANFKTVDMRAQDLGLSFDKLTFSSKDFIGKLKYLAEISGYSADQYNKTRASMILTQYGQIQATKGQAEAQAWLNMQQNEGSARFMKMVGGAAAFIPALILLSGNSDAYSKNLEKMKDRTDIVTGAFDNMRNTTGQQWKMLETRLQNIAIVIGLTLLPYLKTFLMALSNGANHVMAFVQSAGGFDMIASAVRGLVAIVTVMLIPAVIGLVAAQAPIVVAWLLLIGASILVGKALDALGAHFGGIQGFMRDTGPLALALKAALLTVAVVLAVSVVVALYNVAVASWTAAAGMLALEAPFILLVVVIALVVFAVLELVTHWKQVTTFIHGVLITALHAVGDALHHVVGYFQHLGAQIQRHVSAAWYMALYIVQSAIAAIVSYVQGFVQRIVDFFILLYNHNHYFHDLVDAIHAAFLLARDRAVAIWNFILTWLKDAWKTVQDDATKAWDFVKEHIIKPITDARDKVIEIGGHIWKALQDLWKTVQDDATKAWDAFIGLITGIVTKITTAVKTNITDPISNAVSGLVKLATTWGSNLLDNFISGITSKIQAVKDAAGKVAGAVGNFLGFHSPSKEGPGSTADKWMPNLIGMLSDGMITGTPQLHASALRAARAISAGLSGQALIGMAVAGGTGGSSSGSALGASGGGTLVINASFPNATSKDEIKAAFADLMTQHDRALWRKSRTAGYGGGLTSRS